MLSTLTTETQLFLDGLKHLNLPPIEQVPVEILRDQYETMVTLYGGMKIEHITSEDSILEFPNLSKPVAIRSFNIENPQGTIIFAHGGGWTRGSLNTHHVMCQNLAQATHSQVISVDYSLAPESRYPVAINEIEAVYKYFHARQTTSISLSGDSAGANLMAGLVVRLNHQGFKIPEECIFFYPSLDLTGKLDSLNEFAEGYILSKHYDFRVLKGILERKGSLKGYREFPGVIHVFAQFPGLFPEASQTFEWISDFYNKYNPHYSISDSLKP